MTTHYKYPRTYHLPWSLGSTSNDKFLNSIECFENKKITVSIKVDGESTSCYRDHIHARSINSGDHPSRNWVKQFHSTLKDQIPENWRICGENLFAKHSIYYTNLKSYFLGYSVWDDKNVCLSWKETLEWFSLLGITPVEVIYEGVFDEKYLIDLAKSLDTSTTEGYVIRNSESFHYDEFKYNVAKYVRKGHVQTSEHWMHSEIIRNKLI